MNINKPLTPNDFILLPERPDPFMTTIELLDSNGNLIYNSDQADKCLPRERKLTEADIFGVNKPKRKRKPARTRP